MTKDKERFFLSGLNVHELSLVDIPANKKKFLLYKSDEIENTDGGVNMEELETLQAKVTELEEQLNKAGTATAEALNGLFNKLADVEVNDATAKTLSEMAQELKVEFTAKVAEETTKEPAKESTEKLSPELRARFEALEKDREEKEKEVEDLRKAVEKERRNRRIDELTRVSKSAMFADAEKLYELEKVNEDLYTYFVDLLKQAHKVSEKSELFKRLGVTARDASDSVVDRIRKLAKDQDKTIDQVVRENPELAAEYIEERKIR